MPVNLALKLHRCARCRFRLIAVWPTGNRMPIGLQSVQISVVRATRPICIVPNRNSGIKRSDLAFLSLRSDVLNEGRRSDL
jgi:hypothetical protein